MEIFLTRVFLFTILPLLAAGVQIWLDKSTNTRERKIELVLMYLFGLGVAGSGIGGFIGHLFFSDIVAESVGWEIGSPFQLEMAFANLVLGVLGIIAAGRRDGFREATVIAVTILGFGASIVHFMDIIQTGNLAPGNTVQNIANLLKPILLIVFMTASRRLERQPDSQTNTPQFETWRQPRLQAVALMTISVATGFGVGFGIDQLLLVTGAGILVGVVLAVIVISLAPSEARQGGE